MQQQTIFTARKRSCGEVIFLHLSVILFTGGVCIPACSEGVYTPWTHTPTQDTHTPGRNPSRQTPPWADTPPQTATEADGTHPTGMHSCYGMILSKASVKSINMLYQAYHFVFLKTLTLISIINLLVLISFRDNTGKESRVLSMRLLNSKNKIAFQ